ncbi:MAG: phosphatidate cytidylyltransferase [Ginsengibacter sp.]
MPFNISIFKTRALTAIVFVVIMLAGLLWNQWSFILLFIIIHFGCWYEFIKLIKKIHLKNYGYYLPAGLLYITVPVLMIIDLSNPPFRYDIIKGDFLPVIPCIIIFSIWINDTMAYMVGSFIGKTPLSKISPKKTWEGTLGGAVLCIGLMGLTGWYTKLHHFRDWIIIALICAVFGTLGDLLESKLKRMAAVKDSGSIMPGHGGFLDRFDSALVAIPFVWLFVYFFMR